MRNRWTLIAVALVFVDAIDTGFIRAATRGR